jgi:hypothetical protein
MVGLHILLHKTFITCSKRITQLNMFFNVVFAYSSFTLFLFVALAFLLKFIMLLVLRNMERALYLNLKIKNAMMSSWHHCQ